MASWTGRSTVQHVYCWTYQVLEFVGRVVIDDSIFDDSDVAVHGSSVVNEEELSMRCFWTVSHLGKRSVEALSSALLPTLIQTGVSTMITRRCQSLRSSLAGKIWACSSTERQLQRALDVKVWPSSTYHRRQTQHWCVQPILNQTRHGRVCVTFITFAISSQEDCSQAPAGRGRLTTLSSPFCVTKETLAERRRQVVAWSISWRRRTWFLELSWGCWQCCFSFFQVSLSLFFFFFFFFNFLDLEIKFRSKGLATEMSISWRQGRKPDVHAVPPTSAGVLSTRLNKHDVHFCTYWAQLRLEPI